MAENPPPANVNHEGYDRRMVAVEQILGRFGWESESITPIAYVAHAPFPFNNYIYKATLKAPALPSSLPSPAQPGTTPLPAEGSSTLIVRLSNLHADGMNNTHRVQNEVASQYLSREALLKAGLPGLVPAVYAWAAPQLGVGGADAPLPSESGFGWMVGEFKPGADMDGEFPSLSLEEKKDALRQFAGILAAVQRTELPPGVTKFGGLTFDDETGAIVSGQMPLIKGDPRENYAEVWKAKLRTPLEDADKSPVVRGWKEGGVRERIERFIEGGVEQTLDGVDLNLKALVHGDLTMNNLLYDKDTKRITALLDFDWSVVTNPGDVFLMGLYDLWGGIGFGCEKIQANIFEGDFGAASEGLDEEEAKKWEIAKAWDTALARAGGIRPSSVAGIRRIADLRALEGLLSPHSLTSEVMLKRISDEEKAKKRADIEAKIVAWLTEHGY